MGAARLQRTALGMQAPAAAPALGSPDTHLGLATAPNVSAQWGHGPVATVVCSASDSSLGATQVDNVDLSATSLRASYSP